MIRLDRTATEPLHEQLYRQIRDELKSGKFSDGSSRLPSSRALAANRGISRSTVRLAFSKLHAEGYLRSKPGSGTFVANLLPETFLTADQPKTYQPIQRPIRTSDRVRAIPDARVGNQFDLGATGSGAGVSLVRAFLQSTNFRSLYGNASERRFWRRKASTCCAIRRIAATPTCARQLQRTCAISEPRAVIRIRSSSWLVCSRRC
jgi:DNA-binding transcriptional regulator YhcF (GntR family)